MKNAKKNKGKNVNLAVYFTVIVIFIILVSVVFKGLDIVRKSKFDGENRFTVAVVSDNNIDYISVSPKEGTLTRLNVRGVNEDDINILPIPHDALVIANSETIGNPKTYFLKMILGKKTERSDLTIIDLIKLSIYSQGVKDEKILNKRVLGASEDVSRAEDVDFIDPEIAGEKVSIQITNTTKISGLGNKFAKYIANMGGNVVLVNSSSDPQGESKILYREESYTLGRLAGFLDIPKEKNEADPISDIIIIIGKDRIEFFK